MNTGYNSKQTTCLCRDTGGKGTLPAQRTSFNTLDNWGHKTPTQSKKRKDDRKEKVKGSWSWTHNALGYKQRRKKVRKKEKIISASITTKFRCSGEAAISEKSSAECEFLFWCRHHLHTLEHAETRPPTQAKQNKRYSVRSQTISVY